MIGTGVSRYLVQGKRNKKEGFLVTAGSGSLYDIFSGAWFFFSFFFFLFFFLHKSIGLDSIIGHLVLNSCEFPFPIKIKK